MANLTFRTPLACMLLVAAALLCEAVQAEGAEPAAAGSNTAVAVPHTGGGGVANFIVSPSASAAVVAADEADKTKVANNFREQSIQLVRPRADGDGLEVVPEGIAFLRGLPATAHIHVVGVVGPFHGGKSFLLNQLLGHHGFKTGTDVNPTTKGLWTWATPATVENGTFGVLMLDTEGFAASDVTADYDAKIFAVSALFSSHLLYNSVRNIDQATIDYLELLSRRAQLFQLKTAISDGGEKAGLHAHSLFPMPPLTWVVEDFFANTEGGETPTEWLHRLLQKPHKDSTESSGSGKSALESIFPSIDCKTLFLPSTSLQLLRDLSNVGPEDLTPEFKADLQALSAHIVQKLLQHPPARTGPQLAALLEVLVEASNGGQFTKIPSMWKMFVENQLHVASEASAECFKLGVHRVASQRPPLPLDNFTRTVDEYVERCSSLFHSLMVGVGADVHTREAASHTARMSTDRADRTAAHTNTIVSHCDGLAKDAKADMHKFVQDMDLPLNSKTLAADLDSKASTLLEKHHDAVEVYGAQGKDSTAALKAALSRVRKHTLDTNSQQHVELLTLATSEGHRAYQDAADETFSSLTDTEALSDSEITAFHKRALGTAERAFEAFASRSVNEPQFKTYRDALQVNCPKREVVKRNAERIRKLSTQVATQVGNALSTEFAAVAPPIEQSSLEAIVAEKTAAALVTYDSRLSRFAKARIVAELRRELQEDLASLKEDLVNRNDQAWKRIIKRPLGHAFKRLQAEAKSAWSSFLLVRTARAIAEDEITHSAEGRNVNPVMRARAIDSWLTEPRVSDVIASADLWQNIVVAAAFTLVVLLAGCFFVGKRS